MHEREIWCIWSSLFTGSSFKNYTALLALTKMGVYNFTSLTPGVWTVTVSSGYMPVSVSVTATSFVSFSYQFTTEVNDVHGGFNQISGDPLLGVYID
jgi:hypothetical protein